MASAFYVARNRQLRQEQAAAEAAKNDAAFVKDVLRRFDKSKSGGLKFEEVRAWLHAVACSNSSYRGEPISDEQVEWVMRTAMDSKKIKSQKLIASETENIHDMQLNSVGIKRALELWLDYLRNPRPLTLPERNVPIPVNTQPAASESLDTHIHLEYPEGRSSAVQRPTDHDDFAGEHVNSGGCIAGIIQLFSRCWRGEKHGGSGWEGVPLGESKLTSARGVV